jgi:hypothetical protein
VNNQAESRQDGLFESFRVAFAERGGPLLVRHKRSRKLYSLEADVVEVNHLEPRPYVYVWPKTGRRRGSAVWCFLDMLKIEPSNPELPK